MDFFRYFKGHEKKGVWDAIKVGTPEEEAALVDEKYGFCTVLAVNQAAGFQQTLTGELHYTGPFYLDIDSPDLSKSIKTAKKAIDKMGDSGVNPAHCTVWLSGKKGLHITLPMHIFTDAVEMVDLPLIYRELAKSMHVGDVDWEVYTRGKGRMWRLPNRKREDTGTYKVLVTAQELDKLNVKEYHKMVSEPRDIPVPKVNGHRTPMLETLFKFSKRRAEDVKPLIATLIDDNMRNALGDEQLPPCAQDLMSDENIRSDIGFNKKSVQMMKSVRAFVPPTDQKETLEVFARNSSGESHDNIESRLDHVRRSFGTVAGGTDYSWSCRSILSILAKPPCERCPICFIRYQQEDDTEEAIQAKNQSREDRNDDDSQITIRSPDNANAAGNEGGGEGEPPSGPTGVGGGGDNGSVPREVPTHSRDRAPDAVDDTAEGLIISSCEYHFLSQAGPRRVTNYVLRFTKVFIERVSNLDEDRRVAVEAIVYCQNKRVGKVIIDEQAWSSKAAYIGAFGGLKNLAFIGKDEDIQRMKSALLSGIEKTTINIRRVYSHGIHHAKVGGQDVFTYVEPGYSVDQYGGENLYSLSGRIMGAPRLSVVKAITEGEGDARTSEMFRKLFKINQKPIIAQMMGWNMACFLKQHIFAYTNEFPLLSLWGNAEAGKTQTSGLFAALHGIHYLGGSGSENAMPLSLGGGGSTPFAASAFVAETMTVPRLVEEFNAGPLGKLYDQFVEHFKKVFNQHSIKRGTIKNSKIHGDGQLGAYTTDVVLTGPTVLCSEQSIMAPALVHRCVQVQMNQQDRKGPGMEDAFMEVKRDYTYFNRFAKTAYMEVIHINVDQVREWVQYGYDKIPTKVGDRTHYGFCVVLAGIKFAEHLNVKYALGIGEELAELEATFLESTTMRADEIATRKTQSEADRVMQDMAVMSEISSKQDGYPWLPKNQYYFREGNALYLDSISAHSQYCRYKMGFHERPVIQTHTQFKELIKFAPYCESVAAVRDGFARNRAVMKFNIAKLAEKGIEVSCFEEN